MKKSEFGPFNEYNTLNEIRKLKMSVPVYESVGDINETRQEMS